MKVPTRQRQRGLQFNITPLIDIVFLLIIFFLVASHFVHSETHKPVELPEAASGEEETAEAPRRLVVTITSDRQLHVGGKVVQLSEVEQMILAGRSSVRDDGPDRFEVRIRGDKSVPYRVIEPIMLACARSGISNFNFTVIRK